MRADSRCRCQKAFFVRAAKRRTPRGGSGVLTAVSVRSRTNATRSRNAFSIAKCRSSSSAPACGGRTSDVRRRPSVRRARSSAANAVSVKVVVLNRRRDVVKISDPISASAERSNLRPHRRNSKRQEMARSVRNGGAVAAVAAQSDQVRTPASRSNSSSRISRGHRIDRPNPIDRRKANDRRDQPVSRGHRGRRLKVKSRQAAVAIASAVAFDAAGAAVAVAQVVAAKAPRHRSPSRRSRYCGAKRLRACGGDRHRLRIAAALAAECLCHSQEAAATTAPLRGRLNETTTR